jgi:glutathionyl-hydroquinone reductase
MAGINNGVQKAKFHTIERGEQADIDELFEVLYKRLVILENYLTTKGDLLVYGADGLQRLPVGEDGQVLTADSSTHAGIKWADAEGGVGNGGLRYWLNGRPWGVI